MIKLVGVALCLLLTLVHGDSQCSAAASLTRRLGQDWTDGAGINFSSYDLSVTNTGTCPLSAIHMKLALSSGTVISQSWNLDTVDAQNSIYSLSNFGNSLEAGTSYSAAGFILQYTSTASVVVSVETTNCPASCGSTAPTDAPTASPTVAPPTPTPNPVPTPPLSAEAIQQLITAPSELERQRLLEDSHFVFDFKNSNLGETESVGGRTVATSRTNFPAVIGHGIAMTVGFIAPCGINLPHTHPRATEINFIASGRFQAGMFLENGARFIGNILEAGMATVFPQGAIHFEINLECEPAIFVAAFNNEDPGVQTTASSFFGLPVDVAAVSLNISSIQTVEDLAKHLPMNPGVAMEQCMRRCGFSGGNGSDE